MSQILVKFFLIPKTTAQLCLLFLLLAVTTYCHGENSSDQNFPSYKSIEKNVAFWEKIYSHYSLTQAVIHDSNDISKIYEIIPLLGDDLPGASRFNSVFQKQAKEKYREILEKITRETPKSLDEKRVAALFPGPNRIQDIMLAANSVRSQRGQKERFLHGVIHSGRYMKEIKRIIRAYNLPEELGYLPHVESSFNFQAYSKFGAAGIWQFTRTTGKQYLTIDYTLDERLDPILSTHAAAQYLKNSYYTLNSWPLALTSYNYGLAGMVRAVTLEGTYEKIFNNYKQGHFKFASKNFYPEFLAALNIAKKLEKTHRNELEPALSTKYFKLPDYVQLADVSRHFNVSQETIISLNPALLPSVVKGEKHIPKGYSIRLPAGKNTQEQIASFPGKFFTKQQKPSLFHRVQKGDTATSIARQHGISLDSLIKANRLDKYATIYHKQKLLIPGQGGGGTKQTKNSAKLTTRNIPQTSSTNSLSTIPVLLATKKQHPSGKGYDFLPMKDPSEYNVFNIYRKKSKTYGYITAQPEESIDLYSNWLGSSGTELKALNGMLPEEDVNPGQQLLVIFNQTSPTLFEEERLDFLQETEANFFAVFTIIGQKIYQVISGDTLWDLCYNKFDIPLWLLERYNSSISLTKIDTEQELIIPIVQQI